MGQQLRDPKMLNLLADGYIKTANIIIWNLRGIEDLQLAAVRTEFREKRKTFFRPLKPFSIHALGQVWELLPLVNVLLQSMHAKDTEKKSISYLIFRTSQQ